MNPRIFRLRWIGLLAVIAGSIFALPLLCVWQHVHTIKEAKANMSLRMRIEKLCAETAVLQVKVDAGLGQDHIEKFAREKLAMDYPRSDQVIYLESGPFESAAQRGKWLHRIRGKG